MQHGMRRVERSVLIQGIHPVAVMTAAYDSRREPSAVSPLPLLSAGLIRSDECSFERKPRRGNRLGLEGCHRTTLDILGVILKLPSQPHSPIPKAKADCQSG